jgi:hypothetical protein
MLTYTNCLAVGIVHTYEAGMAKTSGCFSSSSIEIKIMIFGVQVFFVREKNIMDANCDSTLCP